MDGRHAQNAARQPGTSVGGAGVIDLLAIQTNIRIWGKYNFPDAVGYYCLLGATGELGELCQAHLRRIEKVGAGESGLRQKEQDEIGDILIFLMHFCGMEGYDIESIIRNRWDTIQFRDWRKHPGDGGR